MAIVQISRITNRKGLQEDLPQLAGAELGWSVDERRLFIGNGTIQEGAPVVGNTEILTEFSDILNFQTTYTYKGDAAGYTVQTGPSANAPVTQSLQSWMDQFATVKDFGAVGDGVTDDTAAINRALYQLYCRETNPQIRRSLFFPAGVYLVNETILIPTYATLIGEGPDSSVIQMTSGDDSALRAYVARTADSLQQTGDNIGSNGATPPQYITISNMGFESLDPDIDVFLVDEASSCTFTNVNFMGPLTTAELTTDSNNTACIRFNSSPSLVCQSITFDKCLFKGTTYGVNTDEQIQGITFTNSKFDTLYKGVVLGEGTPILGGPTGVRIVQNFFNNIYYEGIIFGSVSLNATGYNIFYDVGNSFAGTTNPSSPVIIFRQADNISVGDMFERTPQYSASFYRIDLQNQASIGFVGGTILKIASNQIQAEPTTTLADNTTSTLYTFNIGSVRSSTMDYSIIRGTSYRRGTFRVVPTGGGTLTYDDDYDEDATTGVTFTANQVGNTVNIGYTTSSTGNSASITFTVNNFLI